MLLVTLKDDSDFEVCKASAAIISKLKAFLLKYKLNEASSIIPLPKDSAIMDSNYIKETSLVTSTNFGEMQNASHIIDEIVEANDANLLTIIYKSCMNMDSEVKKEEEKTLHYISSVTRQEFLHTVFNYDIDTYIEEKNHWLQTYTSSFESILDDILTMYKQKDINSMDCY